MLLGIYHIGVVVDDMAEAERFLRDVLGLSRSRSVAVEGGRTGRPSTGAETPTSRRSRSSTQSSGPAAWVTHRRESSISPSKLRVSTARRRLSAAWACRQRRH